MQVINVKKGDLVAKRHEEITAWYLIQSGSVTLSRHFAEVTMTSNSIIGILGKDKFIGDYRADEDTTLIVIPCKGITDLNDLVTEHPEFRPIFLRSAISEFHKALCMYDSLAEKASLLYTVAGNSYEDYKLLCHDLMMAPRNFDRYSDFGKPSLEHPVENWEVTFSKTLYDNYLGEYIQLMCKNADLCVGMIMDASRHVQDVGLGIIELDDYLFTNRDILWNDSEDDIFHLYYYMAVELASLNRDLTAMETHMKDLRDAMQSLELYDKLQLDECTSICNNCHLSRKEQSRVSVSTLDCVGHIMTYAGYDKAEIREFKLLLDDYKQLPDRGSMDKEVRTIRKSLTKKFYEIYTRAFFKSMLPGDRLSNVMQMFFNFGFMDVELLGAEATDELARFAESLGQFHHPHVHTIHKWLEMIYRGERTPSRNDMDQDFMGWLQKQRTMGDVSEKQFNQMRDDPKAWVEFEITNLFEQTHKAVVGRPSTFCPILNSEELYGPFEKLAMTSSRLMQSLDDIRNIDYSLFYREVMFSDPQHGINQEWIMKEVFPDIILMPGIGSRTVMWQETGDVHTDSPARFIFPIFLNTDLDEQMQLCAGRYRWEICRKIQGGSWNDFRVKSLTSEFYDFLQFYRKNKDLSADGKEKLKTALGRARNNFREVFVADYINWLKFESQGSVRLNKISRDILIRYCPFSKEIRARLTSNPTYQNAFQKLEIENQKKISRLVAFYNKYQAAGGTVTDDLKQNLNYYKL